MTLIVDRFPMMEEPSNVSDVSTVEVINETFSNTTDKHPFVAFSEDVVFFCLCVIFPMGLVFNTLSAWVLLSANLRKRSANLYLAALAVSDDLQLITIAIEYWLKHRIIDIPVVKWSGGVCIVVTYFSYATRLFSAMLIMSFTIERFIGVVYPLKRAVLTSSSHVRRVLLFESLTCLLMTAFTTFTIDVVDTPLGRDCDVRPDRAKLYLVCNVIILVFGANVIPICVICSLNAFSLNKICSRRKHMLHNKHFSCRVRRGYNTATVLLTVSTVFVVLTLPYCVSWLMLFFRHFNIGGALQHVEFYQLLSAKYLTSVPYYFNYSINFLLYNICARAFRKELFRKLCLPLELYRQQRHTCRRQSSTSTHQVYFYSSGRYRKDNFSQKHLENGYAHVKLKHSVNLMNFL